MKLENYGFKVKEIGEYNYNYRYRETTVNHHIKEYCEEGKETRIVILEKETRKRNNFVRLPQSLWITREGYPPLSTDGALQKVEGSLLTLYFAGMPTVQSVEHIRLFDDTMREELRKLKLDYNRLSTRVKTGQLFKNCTLTGFVYTKKGTHDEKLLEVFQDKVLKSYRKVLTSTPQRCPIELWTEMIMGPQAEFEYHLFKKWGFDVPLSAQRAFFTIMMGPRISYLRSNEEIERLQSIVNLTKE
ncbi:MAG: hypothetical protein AMJ42_05335 [Deltaproteobacteria bacterium DG_8]|nr:MAG: hypothetical protein AMJ42_05335 [Deltaproteobacteria bacterium DG_8]